MKHSLCTHPESEKRSVSVAVIYRDEKKEYIVPARVALGAVVPEVGIHRVWYEDVKVRIKW